MADPTDTCLFISLNGTAGTTDDRSQVVSGTVLGPGGLPLAGSEVYLTVAQQVVGTAAVASDGSYETEIELPELGTQQVVATVRDGAGATATSAALTYDLTTVLSPPSGGSGAATSTPVKPRAGTQFARGEAAIVAAPAETFVFRPHPGHLTIADALRAGAGHDTFSFSTASFASIVDVLHHTTMSTLGATIHLSPSDSVTLVGVSAAALRAHPGVLELHHSAGALA